MRIPDSAFIASIEADMEAWAEKLNPKIELRLAFWHGICVEDWRRLFALAKAGVKE